VIFAILAHETVCGRCTNVPSATGAEREVILGKVVPGRNGWNWFQQRSRELDHGQC
jgi:hypothetical protein